MSRAMASQIQTTAGDVRQSAEMVRAYFAAQHKKAQHEQIAEMERIASLPFWRRWFEVDPTDWRHDLFWQVLWWSDCLKRVGKILAGLAQYDDDTIVLLDFRDAEFLDEWLRRIVAEEGVG